LNTLQSAELASGLLKASANALSLSVPPDAPDGIETVHAPMPAVVSDELAERLAEWIAGGGRLISEGNLERSGHLPDSVWK